MFGVQPHSLLLIGSSPHVETSIKRTWSGSKCQLPNSHNIPQSFGSLEMSLPLNIFIFVISLCAGRKKRVIWITIPGWTTQIRVPPAPHWLPASPVNTGPSIEALRLGVGIFFLLPIFILTLWKTRRPSSSTAMLSPWHFPLWRLNEDGPPRWSVLASPAHGYSRGCAHLCSPDGDRAPAAGWLSSNKRTQPQTNSSSSSRARGGVVYTAPPTSICWVNSAGRLKRSGSVFTRKTAVNKSFKFYM